MPKKKFYFLWFSPRDRRFTVPQISVNVGSEIVRNIGVSGMNSNLPKWTSDLRLRRALATVTGLILLFIWAVSLSSFELGGIQYFAMFTLFGAAFGALNFSFRSLFDSPDEVLDERLYALRNRYSFPSYQALGLLILLILVAVNFLNLDPSRLWMPALATYASIPYLILGLQERTFA